jgi:hypothetical protein
VANRAGFILPIRCRRGFCRDCGTPLFFDTLQSDGMAVTLGSLDDPCGVSAGGQ